MVVLGKIELILNRFVSAVGLIAATVMIFLMVYITAESIMRIFHYAFVGSNELVMHLIVIVVFFAIGRTCCEDAQIKIDVFTLLPRLDHVTLILSMVMYIFSGIAAFTQAALAYEMEISTAFLSIPRWPFLIIAGIGLILGGIGTLCVELRYIILRHNLHLEKKEALKEVNA